MRRKKAWAARLLFLFGAALLMGCPEPPPEPRIVKAYITAVRPGQCIIGQNVDPGDLEVNRGEEIIWVVFNQCGQGRTLRATVGLSKVLANSADCVRSTPDIPDRGSSTMSCVVSHDAPDGSRLYRITTGEEGDILSPRSDLEIRVLP
jgi:hypothetical protein